MAILISFAVAILAFLIGRWWGFVRGSRRATYEAARRLRDLREDHRQSERRLVQIQADLDTLLETSTDCIFILDELFAIQTANAAARTTFHLDDDLTGAAAPSLVAVIRSPDLREIVEDAARGHRAEQPVRIEERLYGARAMPIGKGRTLLMLRDQTLLERLERARRDLVANVSHDLRTPLTSIALLVEQIERSARAGEPARLERVVQLKDQVDTIETLAEGLVEINRLESGRALFRLEPVSVGSLISESIRTMQPLLSEREVDVDVDAPDDLGVLADRTHVVRMLTNLLDNATHHTPPGGTIRIGAETDAEDPSMIRLWISDDGPGIAPRDLTRIFERFYRGDRARTAGGTGLGLAISKHIVEGHGGSIWAEHDPRGGARFCVTLLRNDVDLPAM